jgi:replicative DNA helicase
VSERILESAKGLSLPVVLGAQLGRPSKVQAYKMENIVRIDNIREAGDIEQDANLMLGLWNEYKAGEERDKTDNPMTERVAKDPIELTVKILKNRGGATGDKIPLDFHRPILTVTDQGKKTRGSK